MKFVFFALASALMPITLAAPETPDTAALRKEFREIGNKIQSISTATAKVDAGLAKAIEDSRRATFALNEELARNPAFSEINGRIRAGYEKFVSAVEKDDNGARKEAAKELRALYSERSAMAKKVPEMAFHFKKREVTRDAKLAAEAQAIAGTASGKSLLDRRAEIAELLAAARKK